MKPEYKGGEMQVAVAVLYLQGEVQGAVTAEDLQCVNVLCYVWLT